MGAIPRLSTERLLLRAWLPSDREPFAGLNADPCVAEFLGESMDRAASRADATFVGFVGLAAPSFETAFLPAGRP